MDVYSFGVIFQVKAGNMRRALQRLAKVKIPKAYIRATEPKMGGGHNGHLNLSTNFYRGIDEMLERLAIIQEDGLHIGDPRDYPQDLNKFMEKKSLEGQKIHKKKRVVRRKKIVKKKKVVRRLKKKRIIKIKRRKKVSKKKNIKGKE
ncbi:hypothetical protein ES703_119233 [subsurface metagenome]